MCARTCFNSVQGQMRKALHHKRPANLFPRAPQTGALKQYVTQSMFATHRRTHLEHSPTKRSTNKIFDEILGSEHHKLQNVFRGQLVPDEIDREVVGVLQNDHVKV